MASSSVVINVRSNLLQVAEHLRIIASASKHAMQSLNPFVKKTDEAITSATRNSLTALQRLQNLSSSIAKKMGDNFKAMFSAMGISQGLKMGQIFGNSLKEAFQLSDQIRKLSSIFGIAESRFVSFQSALVKGLGEIGLSSDAASNSLKGLSETQVRGEQTLVEYAKLSGQLASIGQQGGKEGEISKGIAGVITERGGNPSDVGQAKAVAEDIRKAVSATGLAPTEILSSMQNLFKEMNVDFKKTLSTSGLIQLAVVQKTGGEGSADFLQQYLKKSAIERQIPKARGLDGIFDDKGLNIPKFKKAMQNIFATIPEDMEFAAKTLGVDDSTAKGLIQLYKSLDRVDEAQKRVQADNKTLTEVYYSSMGALEAFTASLNKFKSSLSTQVSWLTNGLTDLLKKGFQTSLNDVMKAVIPKDVMKLIPDKVKEVGNSAQQYLPRMFDENLGSTAVTIGAAVGSAALFGGGINGMIGLLKGKTGGLVEKTAAEQLLGQKAQPVYIVNVDELATKTGQSVSSKQGSGFGDVGFFGKALAATGALAGGYAAGGMINGVLQSATPDQTILYTLNKTLQDLIDRVGRINGLGTSDISVSVNGKQTPIYPGAAQPSLPDSPFRLGSKSVGY